MKKHFSIKPFVIAAAIMTTGAVSVIGASAATTKNVSDLTATAAITEQPAAPEEPAAPTAPEEPVQTDVPAPTETTDKPDTNTELSIEEQKALQRKLIEEAEGLIYEVDGKKMKCISEKLSDMEFIGEDSDGTRHYKSRYGGTASVWSVNGVDEDEYFSYLFVAVD